jgi:hypothetical protein
MTSPPTPTISGRLHWHSDVHKVWAREQLCFYRLKFSPIYLPESNRQTFEKLFQARGITSFALYELHGDWDLLARVWVPANLPAEELDDELNNRLKHAALESMARLDVTKIPRHWVWGEGEYPHPSKDTLLNKRPPDPGVASVNSGQLDSTLMQDLQKLHVATQAVYTYGIKFAMIVTCPTAALNLDQEGRIHTQLTNIVDRAAAGGMADLSLYFGRGPSFGNALIMGRAGVTSFDAIRTQLVYPISEGIGPGAIGARTVTMIVASSEFYMFQEALPLVGWQG